MADDVFCKIIRGDISGEFLYRDDSVVAIRDINPHAPVHVLIIPTAHYGGIGDVPEQEAPLLGHMVRVAHQIAGQEGLAEGYRLILNEGEHGGKIVPHLHLHLLGGKKLGPKLVGE